MQKATIDLVYLSSCLPTHPWWLEGLGCRDEWNMNALRGVRGEQRGHAFILFSVAEIKYCDKNQPKEIRVYFLVHSSKVSRQRELEAACHITPMIMNRV